MPDPTGRTALTSDDVEPLIAALCWPVRPDAAAVGAVGIEVESFPVRVALDGASAGRVPLADAAAALDERFGPTAPDRGLLPCWSLPDGASVTFEPGGQLEYATPPHATAAAALHDVERGVAALAGVAAQRGAVLAGTGIDVWHEVSDVPQQIAVPRYQAMAAYFAARGGDTGPGAVMMRHTCAIQVNLDLGPAAVARERLIVANLVAPLLVATFATSPLPNAVCGRFLAWDALDPTRARFAAGLLAGGNDDDPVGWLAAAALDADVLLFRAPGRAMTPGRPGFAFRDWLRDGHPVHGRPTADDLAYHLSTLWPEVRVRGFLELRSVDALPARWRGVPVVLLAGLLYDDRARAAVRAVLERHRGVLPQLARRAAVTGVAEPEVCALAVETWSLALAGARRLPPGYFRGGDLVAVEAFLDRFTLQGRCPADELRERLAVSPATALAWAADPVDTLTAV